MRMHGSMGRPAAALDTNQSPFKMAKMFRTSGLHWFQFGAQGTGKIS